jgi:ribosomal protein S18 acetylase RimI-like enzyme
MTTLLASKDLLLDSLCIRCAEEADLVALEWHGEYTQFRRIFFDTFQQSILGLAKIWIAEIAGHELIGQLMVSLKGNRPELTDGVTRAYVHGFRVQSAYRNRGIGRWMMQTIENDLRQNGFLIVTLNVAKTNTAARRFYERLDYSVVGSEPGHWSYLDQYGKRQEVYEPAWRMEKMLPWAGKIP